MNLHTFVAESPAEAVRQAREQLGPNAIVVNLRKVSSDGLSRIWRKPRIELVACLPEPQSRVDHVDELRKEIAAIREHMTAAPVAQAPPPASFGSVSLPNSPDLSTRPIVVDDDPDTAPAKPRCSFERLITRSGLLPIYAERLFEEVQARLAGTASSSELRPPAWVVAHAKASAGASEFARQWTIAREILMSWWTAPQSGRSNTHLFVGPAGTGKTTVLCKWMSQAVLMENRRARVWRLDGASANTAESLSIFAEIMGIPLDRVQPTTPSIDPSELLFIDLPGVNWADAAEISALASRVNEFGNAQLHLVLNAAYESQLLTAQARAFQSLPITDIVLTHTDEDSRWGKAWNLALGTNFSVGYLSAGQNIPGCFSPADPRALLPANWA